MLSRYILVLLAVIAYTFTLEHDTGDGPSMLCLSQDAPLYQTATLAPSRGSANNANCVSVAQRCTTQLHRSGASVHAAGGIHFKAFALDVKVVLFSVQYLDTSTRSWFQEFHLVSLWETREGRTSLNFYMALKQLPAQT